MSARGYFGIGIAGPKTASNVGTLWRSAYQLGADFIFTVGARYPRQASDTVKAWRHVPLWRFDTREEFAIPNDCQLVAVEMGGRSLASFVHPERAMYVLGAEDHGVPKWVLDRAVHVVSIESVRAQSFNVAVAGSLVMHDRMRKRGAP